MADNSNNIFSYTKRDYDSARREGLSQIPTLSKGVWTDLNVTDPGIIMLDYVHALVDMINYYQDHQALETFISTAKERSNIFRLAKQLSYKITSAKSAKVDVVFHSKFLYDNPIKIPKGTKLTAKGNIPYITIEDAYLRAGESEVTVTCQQGTVYTKEYQGTGLSRYSNVEPPENVDQYIDLTTENIDTDSIVVTESIGEEKILWTPVDYIVFSTATDKVYQVDLNPDNTVTIRFGDGERGIVPKETTNLTISYLVTDAEDGRIGINSMMSADPIYDEDDMYIELEVSNPEASIGGYAAQSSNSIRELAPGAIKSQNRAVTLSDFENLAKLVPGVLDARAYDINRDSTIPFHEVRVLIVPEEYTSTKVLLSDVYSYLYERMIPPTNLQVTLPTSKIIDINVSVKKMPNVVTASLEYEIKKVIEDYFESRKTEIGEDFYPTDLSTMIAKLESVRSIISMSPSTSSIIEVTNLSVATLGTITVTIE